MTKRLILCSMAVALLGSASRVSATPYNERSAFARAALTTVAAIANITPGVSAVYAKRCLPGYLVCKVAFAGASVVLAAEQVLLSGGGDMPQAKELLRSGFGGDWFLTGRHVNGDVTPAAWADSQSLRQ